MTTAPTGGEIVSTRVLDAPRDAVFAAFSDPVRLAAWWGPEGFTNDFETFDFRTGGTWRFVMQGADGAEYQLHKEFTEVVPPERIAIRHVQEGHGFLMTITLDEEGERTRMTWRMRFDDPEEGERVRDFIADANEQNSDRLEAHLGAAR